MLNRKISELPAALGVSGDDLVPMVDVSTSITQKVTLSQIVALATTVTPGGVAGSVQYKNGTAFDGSAELVWDGSTLLVDGALDLKGQPAPEVSPSGSARVYFDSSSSTLKFSQNAGVYASVGTVTSVNVDGGSTGLTFSGGPVVGSGSLTMSGTLDADNGGTGRSTLTAGSLLVGNTTSPVNLIAPGSDGHVLMVVSGAWTSAAPATNGTVTSVTGASTVSGLTLTGTVTTTGALTLDGTLGVAGGGTGATSLTGYVKGTGTAALTASSTIPGSDVSGNISGNAANVTGTVAVGNGGTGATTLTGYVKGSGTSALTASSTIPVGDISGTLPVGKGGTGAVSLTGYVKGTGTAALTASASIPGSDVSGNISGSAANVTGVVAILNGGTGATSKTAAFDALSPAEATGDLITFDGASSTNVSFPVGADNQVLTADSTQPFGLRWADPGGGGTVTGSGFGAQLAFFVGEGSSTELSSASGSDSDNLWWLEGSQSLVIRSSALANNAIALQVGGPVAIPRGSASAPSLTFHEDSAINTGIFSPFENQFAISTNGVQRLNVTTSGITVGEGLTNYTLPLTRGTVGQVLQTDGSGGVTWQPVSAGGTVTGSGAATRVAFWDGTSSLSSNANLFWNNTNNRLGVGTSEPSYALEVTPPANDGVNAMVFSATAADRPLMTLTRGRGSFSSPTALQNGDLIGDFGWAGSTAVGTLAGAAKIRSTATETWNLGSLGSDMRFLTVPNGTANPTEQMVITHDGKVGISTLSPATALDVAGVVTANGVVIDSDTGLTVESVGSSFYKSTVLPDIFTGVDDYNIGTGTFFTIVSTADTSEGGSTPEITGITGGADGRVVHLLNSAGSTSSIIFVSESASSADINRMSLDAGYVTIENDRVLSLIYDGTTQRWKKLSGGEAAVTLSTGITGLTVNGTTSVTGSTFSLSGTLATSSGGTGTGSLASGYVKSSGSGPLTSSITIPTGDLTGVLSVSNGGTGLGASYSAGDMLYATGPSTLARLPSAAVGNVLKSNNIGGAPSWGKVFLASDVSGTLAVANGGTGVTSLGTGSVAALQVNVGTAGSFVVNGGALGTPASGTLTNATGLPISGGTTGTLPLSRGGTNNISAVLDPAGVVASEVGGNLRNLILGDFGSQRIVSNDQALFVESPNVLPSSAALLTRRDANLVVKAGNGTSGISTKGKSLILRGGDGEIGSGSGTIKGGDVEIQAGLTSTDGVIFPGDSGNINVGTVADRAENINIGYSIGGNSGGMINLLGFTNISLDCLVNGLSLGCKSSTTNALFGRLALTSGFSATRCVAIGERAASTVTGANADSVAVGQNAQVGTTSVGQNTSIGSNAGSALIDGSTNVFVGFNAGNTTTFGSNNICIGANTQTSGATTVNEIVIGNASNTRVRFCEASSGTPNPGIAFAEMAPALSVDAQPRINIGHLGNKASEPFIRFLIAGGNGTGAAITQAAAGGFAILYSNGSDYRLKQDVETMDTVDALERVRSLRPVRFRYTMQPDGPLVEGFIAHEAQAVVPQAVTHHKDAVDAEGNPQYQGIDQSHLVPVLTAACKELASKLTAAEARADAAEARLAALEAAVAALQNR